MLTSYGYGTAPVTSVIGITSVWNTLVTLSFPVIGLIALSLSGQSSGEALTVTLIATVAVIAMIVLLALVLRSEDFARKIGGWTDRIVEWGASVLKKDVDFELWKQLSNSGLRSWMSSRIVGCSSHLRMWVNSWPGSRSSILRLLPCRAGSVVLSRCSRHLQHSRSEGLQPSSRASGRSWHNGRDHHCPAHDLRSPDQ